MLYWVTGQMVQSIICQVFPECSCSFPNQMVLRTKETRYLHLVCSCRSQPLHRRLGAEEERQPVPPAPGSRLLCVRCQEAAEQGHGLHSSPSHDEEVPQGSEAQTVPGGGSAGSAVC